MHLTGPSYVPRPRRIVGIPHPPAAARGASKMVAKRMSNLGCLCPEQPPRTLSGFSLAQGTSAVSTAATGAKIGTAVLPGVGTAVGAVLGLAASLFGIGGHHQSSWDKYRKGGAFNQYPGRAWETAAFQSTFDRMIAEDKPKCYPPHRINATGEANMAWTADQIARALAAGQINAGDDAGAIFQRVIVPQWNQLFPEWNAVNKKPCNAEGDTNRVAISKITIDLIDRLLAGQPLRTSGDYSLATLVKKYLPASSAAAPVALPASPVAAAAASQQTMQPVTVSTANTQTAPAQISPVTTPPAGPVSTSGGVIQTTIDSVKPLIEALQQRGASLQDTFNAAMAQLQSTGTASTPEVQTAVASQVAAAAPKPSISGGQLAVLGLGLFFILKKRK